jgi:hypothetical protein
MHKDLGKYVDAGAVVGSIDALTAGFLAPGYCSSDKRSRNIIDVQGVEDLTRDLTPLTDCSCAVTEVVWGAGACLRKRAICLRKFYVNEHASRERMATNEAGM